ncbi:hypothetical protein KL86DES1_21520 [uncultured Desulfovibrio sp.]|uniref:Uncharacterized protein n=1 Tax=uncultured Desulfovibrio sp. TaxID=167968 RepID=A0A212L8B9_9BACT|nr:hypothetical protein KL86DES1_21520 [uncultured Desulfovibrio sp.]VZH34419.1 conserved protein of unknown function [Desulfovibrio sp. 86]
MWGRDPFAKGSPPPHPLPLEQINFEMLHISKFSFSRKMRFATAISRLLVLLTKCCLCP